MNMAPDQSLKPTPEAEALYRRWIAHLNDEFSRHQTVERRSEIVRDELYQIFLGRPHGGRLNTTLDSELAFNVLTESFDPQNVTIKAEYEEGGDREQLAIRKPLIYMWHMFDLSPLGANLWLGFRFRCMLGHHIFKQMGKGVTIYPNVRFTRGYNLTIEDNCIIYRNSVLDDRNELVIPAGSVIKP